MSGVDEDCTVCNGRFGNGKHLRIHCPEYPKDKDGHKAKQTPDKPSTKRKGQARVAGGDTDGSDDESYYEGTDGVDLASTSDVALSELFAGG